MFNLMQIQLDDNTIKIMKALSGNQIFVILLVTIIILNAGAIVRFIQEFQNKKTSDRTNNDILSALNMLVELGQGKVYNIVNLQGANGIIDRYYSLSKLEIQGLLADIYVKNNIHNPERKIEITDNLNMTIKNLYKRDMGALVLFRYKTKRLSEYMDSSIQPQILIDGITERLFTRGVKSADMMNYIENCFDKYISETQKYYETL